MGMSNDHETEDLNFEFQCCPPSGKSDTDSSTTTSSSLSPKKAPSPHPASLPPHSLLTVNTNRHPLSQHHSFSSLSTASPQSSVCSQSSSRPPSPLTLSPSPSSHCDEEDKLSSPRAQAPPNQAPVAALQTDGLFSFPSVCADCEAVEMMLERQKPKPEDEDKDEWPDLSGESNPAQVARPEHRLSNEQTAIPYPPHSGPPANIMQWFASIRAPGPGLTSSPPTQFFHPPPYPYIATPTGVQLLPPGYPLTMNGGVLGGSGHVNYHTYCPQYQQLQQPSSGYSWPCFDDASPPPPSQAEVQAHQPCKLAVWYTYNVGELTALARMLFMYH